MRGACDKQLGWIYPTARKSVILINFGALTAYPSLPSLSLSPLSFLLDAFFTKSMQLTLENLQTLLTDLTSFIHFFLAVVVLLIILLAAHAFPFHHDYSFLTTAFHVARSCCHYLSIYNLPLRSGIWLSSSVTSVAMDEDEIGNKQPPVESVCLCEDIAAGSTTLVSGLVNTGNSCYINSVLQVRKGPLMLISCGIRR